MESKYFKEKSEGLEKYVYSNEKYDLVMNTEGKIDLNSKTHDTGIIIKQLAKDLFDATIRIEALMSILKELAQQQLVSDELIENLSSFVYRETTEEKARKEK